jgi:hypothetical protein
LDRKKFGARLVQFQPEKSFHSLYWDAINGKDIYECISALILRNLKNNFNVSTKLAGGIKFSDYKPLKK